MTNATTTELLATINGGEYAFGVAKIDRGYSVACYDTDLDMFISEIFPVVIFMSENEAVDFALSRASLVFDGFGPEAL